LCRSRRASARGALRNLRVELEMLEGSYWVPMTAGDIAGEGGIDGKTRNLGELNRTILTAEQMAVDVLILTTLSFLSLGLVLVLESHQGIRVYWYLLPTIGATLTLVFGLAHSGAYDLLNTRDRVASLSTTVRQLTATMLLLTGCFFVLKISDTFSRIWLATWSVTSVVALCSVRLIMICAAERLIRTGRLTRKVAIVGAIAAGQQLAAQLADRERGAYLVGLFDERRSRLPKNNSSGTAVAQLSALYELLYEGRVDEVVIAMPPYAAGRILDLSQRFHPFAVSLRILAPEGYQHFRVLDTRLYGEIGTFRVMGKPLDEAAIIVKRLEDIVIALLCLLFVLPLMLLIALAIKLDSPGPVLFRQKRLGAHNLPFDLLKFRSMYMEESDPLGRQLTLAGDPRITRVGRWLRKASLDELPQLINVLRGEMSLVGPRPHALAASAAGVLYAQAISEYPIRHRVKPGITGWAQVNGWRGETTTIEQIRRRVEHDLYYIDNWSLAFDLLILSRTVFTVLSRANAV
jgi:Undecaprenyl-phosphate glucose phosphotransferase